jgi:nicotinamide-nucleotide amidase
MAMILNTPAARDIASRLIERKETVSVAESSTGGLIAATLLAVPGASAYFLGGSVVYTLPSRKAFLDIPRIAVTGMEPLSEAMVAVFAEAARRKLGATWGIAEMGAAGPTGTRYGHAAGTSVIGIDGPVRSTRVVKTGSGDREQNMYAFAAAAMELFLQALNNA